MEKRVSTVLLGIVEGYALGKVRVRSGSSSQHQPRRPQGTMRRHEHGSILHLLRQGQELLAQCLRRLELGTLAMIVHEPTQHRETLVRRFQMLGSSQNTCLLRKSG